MLKKITKDFNNEEYKFFIGDKSNIHKVSYFLKKKDLKSKKILFIDFEFSKEYNIYEMGGLILQDGKIIKKIFKEFKLPSDNSIFDFNTKKMNKITNSFNKGRETLNPSKVLELIDSVDYIVCHNYVAEIKCILKLRYPNEPYNISNCKLMNSGKVICTNYTFCNRYFKNEFKIEQFSNSAISKRLSWSVNLKNDKILISNKIIDVDFKISPPKEFFNAKNQDLHNSFYDSVVTLTNFLSCRYIEEKKN